MVTVARQPGGYIKQGLVAVGHFSEFLPASSVSSRYVEVDITGSTTKGR